MQNLEANGDEADAGLLEMDLCPFDFANPEALCNPCLDPCLGELEGWQQQKRPSEGCGSNIIIIAYMLKQDETPAPLVICGPNQMLLQ